jgi:hypothetical protein
MADSVATAAGQGAPAAGVQPGGNGAGNGAAPAGQGAQQGSPTAGSNGDGQFNWGLFPDVPVEARELVQPHLKTVQGHVTRMEQENAPYQSLRSIVQPDQVENLVGFLNQYNADPVATTIGLVQQGLQDGTITAEQIQQLAGQSGTPAAPSGAQPEAGQEEVPQWAQQLQQRLEAQEVKETQEAQARQEAELTQVMEQAKTNIRAQLTQGGIEESVVTDEMIVAAVLANNGDEQAAANSFIALRQAFLGAFTQNKTTPGKQPVVNGEVPKTPKGRGGRRGDGFDSARTGALQHLKQQQAMTGG